MSNLPQPPANSWASGHTTKSSGSWIAPMIVGAAIFGTGCGGGLVAGWFAGIANSFGQNLMDYATTPFEADVTIDAPSFVSPGETFDISVTITDTSGNPRTVHDIDFDGFLNSSVEIIDIQPTPYSTYSDDDYREHNFDSALAANGSATFTFTVRPAGNGPVEGNITVYLDGYSSQDYFVGININEAGNPPDSTPDVRPEPAAPGTDTGG